MRQSDGSVRCGSVSNHYGTIKYKVFAVLQREASAWCTIVSG